METTYTISELDYVKVTDLWARITPKALSVFALVVIILLVVYSFAPTEFSIPLISGFAAGMVTLLAIRLIAMPVVARRHYRRYKAIHEPITLRLSDEGLRFTTADSVATLQWDKIYRWRHDNHYILIYSMPRLFFVVPRTVAHSGFDLPSLMRMLRARIGNES